MTLTGEQLAFTVARVGAMRVGAFRVGFTPRDTRHPSNLGQPGPLYTWRRVYPATSTITIIKT